MSKVCFSCMLATACILVMSVSSCRNNEDSIPPVVTTSSENNELKGEIKSGEKKVLDATKVYKLTGAIIVKDGGTLTIPAGTRIEAIGGTSSYITVEQGGKIFVNGTATAPVVFTSTKATSGSWGGIVICGKAPGNKGVNATAEVGNASYGGTDPADNSGVISYARIEYAGAIFSGDKEFNGLSLFGVGNGTTINNVSILNGADDGIEFFGGTVNVSNIICVGNEDDAFDWTEGWSGTADGIYTKRLADGRGNRGIEGDNNSNDNNIEPRSNPTIRNATFIGAKRDKTESEGMKLRAGTYATVDNVVLSGWKVGLDIQHDSSVDYFNGSGKITNIAFDDVDKKISMKFSDGKKNVTIQANTYTEGATKGAGNGTAIPSWANGWAGNIQ